MAIILDITAITDSLVSSRTQAVTYDDLNRVATASGAYGSQSYTYDGVGNRLTRGIGGTTETYAYSPIANQVATITSGGNVRAFTYQPSGQVSADARDPSDIYTFAANDNGRNASAALNGTTAGAYLYNAFEQRVQKTVGSAVTQFVFDRFGHLLAEANASGATQKEYLWLDDVPVALVDDTAAAPVLYYVHTDQLGTPQKLTGPAGSIVWDGVLDPFGNPQFVSGGVWGTSLWGSFTWGTDLSLTNLRFPGQYLDGETALNQNWFRDYDPTIGRYIQSDPIGLRAGPGTYAYVGGNPLSNADQNGLQALPLPWLFPPPGIPSAPMIPGAPTPYSQMPSWLQNLVDNLMQMAGRRDWTNVRNRPCNSQEMSLCKLQCGTRGVESCMMVERFRISGIRGFPVRKWVTGPMSFSCNEDPCWQ